MKTTLCLKILTHLTSALSRNKSSSFSTLSLSLYIYIYIVQVTREITKQKKQPPISDNKWQKILNHTYNIDLSVIGVLSYYVEDFCSCRRLENFESVLKLQENDSNFLFFLIFFSMTRDSCKRTLLWHIQVHLVIKKLIPMLNILAS